MTLARTAATHPLVTLTLRDDLDVVTARQRAASVASALGYDQSEQTRIATAVSEIARNACRYSGGGDVVFAVDVESAPPSLLIQVSDRGPGIPHLDQVLAGTYRSHTGLGIGIIGSRRLMDRLEISSSPEGTAVSMRKFLPHHGATFAPATLAKVRSGLEQRRPATLVEEYQAQNQELLRALEDLQRSRQELIHLNRELEDTNRGVVALYAELDEKAEHLRRANELKSRFLSNVTHEFRTPVNSIIGLCNLMAEERQKEGREPDREIFYIRKAAAQLSELVNDLLDFAKVAAGKTTVRPTCFNVDRLFRTLRGMLRPLLLDQSVTLVFDDATELPEIVSDESKVSQILRNLISNSLKFTERGEVRVTASLTESGRIGFAVSDTGIGIPEEDRERIFEEFAQVENPLQRSVRGTGLGLPLSRRLAELLGGSIAVRSEPGIGSTFTLTLPIVHRAHTQAPGDGARDDGAGPGSDGERRLPEPEVAAPAIHVLVIEDEDVSRFVIRQCLPAPPFELTEAETGEEALAALRRQTPDIILLDLMLPDVSGQAVLEQIRGDPVSHAVPVLIVTGTTLEPSELAYLLQRSAGVLSKAQLSRESLGRTIRGILAGAKTDRPV